jgi:hypothetical protein
VAPERDGGKVGVGDQRGEHVFKQMENFGWPGCGRLLIGLALFPAALAANAAHLQATYASSPLIFEPNQGQSDPSVLYLSRNKGFTLFLTKDEAVLKFPGAQLEPAAGRRAQSLGKVPSSGALAGPKVLRLRWLGIGPDPRAEAALRLPGHSNYFLGQDPSRWALRVPQYGQVRFPALYPGIALTYYDAGQRTLEFDWKVSAGSDPSTIRLQLEGMDACRMDAGGDVQIDLGNGRRFLLKAPLAYQDVGNGKVPVRASYLLDRSGLVTLDLGPYNHGAALVIDPVLVYATYLGGTGADAGNAIATDAEGSAYVAGETSSTNFPVQGAVVGSNPDEQDAFVTKLSPDGASVLYSTYLGGTTLFTGTSNGAGIAVDASGCAYTAGWTSAADFPLANAFKASCFPCASNASTGFVAKLNAAGDALDYSTFLGGNIADFPKAVAVDAKGCAYVTGYTSSGNFPTQAAFQATCNGCTGSGSGSNAFLTKFKASGTGLAYSTFLGKDGGVGAGGVAVDVSGCAYIGGSGNVPLANAYSSTGNGFVTKFSASGGSLVYSTQVPGVFQIYGLAVDPSNQAYVTGQSYGGLPLVNPFQSNPSVATAFVTKFNPSGTALVYSTYLGGGPVFGSQGNAIAVDTAGDAYVAGQTTWSSFPLASPTQANCPACTACPSCSSGYNNDGFISEFDPAGAALNFSSFIGGSGMTFTAGSSSFLRGDQAEGVAVDPSGNIYVTGLTYSSDFPVQSAVQPANGGYVDAFAAKIGAVAPVPTPTAICPSQVNWLAGITDTGSSAAFSDGDLSTSFGFFSAGGVFRFDLGQVRTFRRLTLYSTAANTLSVQTGPAYAGPYTAVPGQSTSTTLAGGIYKIDVTFPDVASRYVSFVIVVGGGAPAEVQVFGCSVPTVTPTPTPTPICGAEVNWLAGVTNTGSNAPFNDGDLVTPFGFFAAGAIFSFDFGQTRTFHRMTLYSTASNTFTVRTCPSFTGPYTVVPGQTSNTTLSGGIYKIDVTFPDVTSRYTNFAIGVGGGAPTELQVFGCVVPTPTPTATVTPTRTASPTFSASPTMTATLTSSPSFTVSPTRTATPTLTPTFTITPTFTATPTKALATDAFILMAIFPNPFGNTGTNLMMELGYQAAIKFNVYTVRGELAYSFTWPSQGPGKVQLAWNGHNNDGAPLANGAYYVTLDAAGGGQDHSLSRWISIWR